MLNRIDRGAVVYASDGEFGRVHQVVVDTNSKQLTHVVVSPTGIGTLLLVPAEDVLEGEGSVVRLRNGREWYMARERELAYEPSGYEAISAGTLSASAPAASTGSPVLTDVSADTVAFETAGTGTSHSDTNRMSASATGGQPAYARGSASVSGETEADTTLGAAAESTGASGASTSEFSQTFPQGTGRQRKGKELIGLPIITFSDGRRLGSVKDILVDPDQNRVIALLADTGGWFSAAKVIPWTSIRTVGPDSIIVPDATSVIPANTDSYIRRIMDSRNVLSGTRVYTEDGRDLGTIGDMFLEDSSGQVVGYEVSGGLFNATLKGKKFMPAPATITVGKDVAFVPSSVGDEMEAQVGGLQGAAQHAGDQAAELGSRTAEQRDAQLRASIGRPVGHDVYAQDGTAIALRGTTLDEGAVNRAELYGKQNELLAAVGAGSANEALGQARDNISSTFSNLRAKLDEVTSRQDEARQQRRMEYALGRPVTRVILNQQDEVILDTGQIITHRAVEQAREAGVLNLLLDSVYEGAPDLAPDSFRSGETGQASLPAQHNE